MPSVWQKFFFTAIEKTITITVIVNSNITIIIILLLLLPLLTSGPLLLVSLQMI